MSIGLHVVQPQKEKLTIPCYGQKNEGNIKSQMTKIRLQCFVNTTIFFNQNCFYTILYLFDGNYFQQWRISLASILSKIIGPFINGSKTNKT